MTELVFSTVQEPVQPAVIKVIGVGGGGCNAINNMIDSSLSGVEFISTNTDAQSLQMNKAPKRIQLGTSGLGAGGDPEIGRNTALESREVIADAVRDAHMVFIATGMGGGTGTGAAPVIAEIVKDMGILTVAVVTRPYEAERKRNRIAQAGLDLLKEHVDSLIVIPNDKLFELDGDLSHMEADKMANDVLCSAVAGISEIVTCPGIINLDFADVKNVMSIKGHAMMGSAEVSGEDRARLAVEQAASSPLLNDISLEGARGILVNITTAPGSLKNREYREIMNIVSQYADPEADLKYGTAQEEDMDERTIRVTLVATGLREKSGTAAHGGLHVVHHAATGTDDGYNMEHLMQSGRRGRVRGMSLTAEDFKDEAVMEHFDIPTTVRRQID